LKVGVVITILILDLLLELFEILNVVNVIGDLCPPTRDADFFNRRPGFLLLLMGTGTILRVRRRRRSMTSKNYERFIVVMGLRSNKTVRTLWLIRGSGGGALLRFLLFCGFFLDAIFLISVAAVVFIVSVILIALDYETNKKQNSEYMRTESSAS
jgi:hypothetical protein